MKKKPGRPVGSSKRAETVTVYARVSPRAKAWLTDSAHTIGVSVSVFLDLLLIRKADALVFGREKNG